MCITVCAGRRGRQGRERDAVTAEGERGFQAPALTNQSVHKVETLPRDEQRTQGSGEEASSPVWAIKRRQEGRKTVPARPAVLSPLRPLSRVLYR